MPRGLREICCSFPALLPKKIIDVDSSEQRREDTNGGPRIILCVFFVICSSLRSPECGYVFKKVRGDQNSTVLDIFVSFHFRLNIDPDPIRIQGFDAQKLKENSSCKKL
jgi:hypothetical protein